MKTLPYDLQSDCVCLTCLILSALPEGNVVFQNKICYSLYNFSKHACDNPNEATLGFYFAFRGLHIVLEMH